MDIKTDKECGMISATDMLQDFEDKDLNLIDSYTGALTAVLTGILCKTGTYDEAEKIIYDCLINATRLCTISKEIKSKMEKK